MLVGQIGWYECECLCVCVWGWHMGWRAGCLEQKHTREEWLSSL